MYDSMVFYRSFYEALKDLPYKNKARIYDAVFAYGLDGVELELNGVEKAVFALIKPQIDANNKRKENGKKGAEYGKLGGRKHQTNPTETPKEPQDNPTPTPNVNVNANVNVDKKENTKKKKFPPTREEVKAYIREKNLSVDGDQFFDYFTEGKWIDAKGQKVTSWKQKLLTWDRFGSGRPKDTKNDCVRGTLKDEIDELERLSLAKIGGTA